MNTRSNAINRTLGLQLGLLKNANALAKIAPKLSLLEKFQQYILPNLTGNIGKGIGIGALTGGAGGGISEYLRNEGSEDQLNKTLKGGLGGAGIGGLLGALGGGLVNRFGGGAAEKGSTKLLGDAQKLLMDKGGYEKLSPLGGAGMSDEIMKSLFGGAHQPKMANAAQKGMQQLAHMLGHANPRISNTLLHALDKGLAGAAGGGIAGVGKSLYDDVTDSENMNWLDKSVRDLKTIGKGVLAGGALGLGGGALYGSMGSLDPILRMQSKMRNIAGSPLKELAYNAIKHSS